MEPLARARVLACPTLPSLPAVALEVLELCRRDDRDLDAIALVLQRDPAIAAKLLRLANSASIATRGKVTTLSRAIAIVGTKATLTTALSFSLVRTRRRGDAGGFDHGSFWRRAVFCALAGRALAELAGLDPEEVFLAGLLQDVGQLALNEVFGGEYGQVWLAAAGDHAGLAGLERDALGLDHAEAGELLARSWNLPEVLCAAIAGSHLPGPASAADLGSSVVLSGALAEVWVGPPSPSRIEESVAAAEARFGQAAGLVRAALARMALAVPEAASDFELELGSPELVEGVLAQARAARSARGAAPEPPPGAGLLQDAARTARDAFTYARAHGHGLALLLARPLGGTSPGEVSRVLAASLRRTDLVGPWGGLELGLVFQPGAGAVPAIAARVRARAEASGVTLALAHVEASGRLPFSDADAFLAAGLAALDAAAVSQPAPPPAPPGDPGAAPRALAGEAAFKC